MGYLDNSTVTVDAILTNKGRQLLAAGGQLNITKFALSDDEVDYDLWNPEHSLGSNYYGAVIENMPVLEALPDETQLLRHKLVTLPKDSIGIPYINVNPGSVSFKTLKEEVVISPSTERLADGNKTLGYTAILSDDTVASLRVMPSFEVVNSIAADTSLINYVEGDTSSMTTAGNSVTAVGLKFILTPKALTEPKNALLTIVGNETGGFKTIAITITQATITASSDIVQSTKTSG